MCSEAANNLTMPTCLFRYFHSPYNLGIARNDISDPFMQMSYSAEQGGALKFDRDFVPERRHRQSGVARRIPPLRNFGMSCSRGDHDPSA